MKKFLILSLMFLPLGSFAACPIDISENAVCTLPEFREQITPIFEQSNGIQTNINTPSAKLQPLNRADPINQMREPNNNLNYNSGCQFGVCLQNPKESRLPVNSGID